MTTILLYDIETVFEAILIQLIDLIPALLGIWLLFWFTRTLLIKD